jgi:chromosome segregation ATPase
MANYIHDLPIPERVKALCNELYSQGGKVSVRSVLAQMPDVKSTSTIHKYYAEWRKELGVGQQSLYDRLGFSTEFTQGFLKEITRFSVEAENRYKDLATDADEQRTIAIDDLTRADERLYKQFAVVEQLEKELNTVKTEATEQTKAVEATLVELRKQIDNLNEDNKTLLASNETLRTEVAKAQLAVEHHDKYISEVRSNHQSLLADHKTLQAQLADHQQRLAHKDAENIGQQTLIVQLRESEKNLKDNLNKRDAEITELRSDTRMTRAELESTQRQLSEGITKIHDLEKIRDSLQRSLFEQAAVIKTFTEASNKPQKVEDE